MIGCPKNKRWISKDYREWITMQPVLIDGQGETIAHHLRIDSNSGTGMKPSDFYCVPLPKLVHDNFHAGQLSDREFFESYNIDIYRELHKITSKFIEEELNG